MPNETGTKKLHLQLTAGDYLPIIFQRQKRNSIRLAISPHGEVVVSAPLYADEQRVMAFVKEKENWLLRQFQRLEESVLLPILSKKEEAERKKALREEAEAFYRALPGRFPKRPSALQIRAQKSRWGSCSGTGTISLNVYLTFLPEKLRHYVFLHELCHLKHPHHQKAFWDELEKLCPGCLQLRRELRRYHLPK